MVSAIGEDSHGKPGSLPVCAARWFPAGLSSFPRQGHQRATTVNRKIEGVSE